MKQDIPQGVTSGQSCGVHKFVMDIWLLYIDDELCTKLVMGTNLVYGDDELQAIL